MTSLKTGLVGFGKMGMLHGGILNTIDGVQLTSVTEKESILTKYIKTAMPTINVYQDFEEMLESEDLDLVFITTPVAFHLPTVLSCIKGGINFFVEKPLTRNQEEAKKICDELKKSSIVHSVGYNVRFIETFSRVKSFLDQKILGDVSSVNSSMYVSNIFSKPSGWRFEKKISGGGVLLELGCHLVDLLLWYFGTVKKVYGQTKSVYSEVEDFASAELEFADNIHGELDTSWSKEGFSIPEINLKIVGSNGELRVNQDFIEIKLKNPKGPVEKTHMKIYKQELEKGVPFDVAGLDYTKEDINVVESVMGKKQPLVNVFEASRTQSVIQTIYDSAATKRSLTVEYIE